MTFDFASPMNQPDHTAPAVYNHIQDSSTIQVPSFNFEPLSKNGVKAEEIHNEISMAILGDSIEVLKQCCRRMYL